MSKVVAVLALILGIVLALFVVQNDEQVPLRFLWFTTRALPVSLAILAAAILGLVVGMLILLPGRLAVGRAAGNLRRDAARRDAQAIPLGSSPSSSEITPTPADADVPGERGRF